MNNVGGDNIGVDNVGGHNVDNVGGDNVDFDNVGGDNVGGHNVDDNVDDENRVRSLVWVDPRSMNAYKNFGDVVTFDSTYRTNGDETEALYKWVLRTWLEAVDNKLPRTIITDQDIALVNVIA
ncbi:hypothetical protein AgCh_025166 [Apium graveolens]